MRMDMDREHTIKCEAEGVKIKAVMGSPSLTNGVSEQSTAKRAHECVPLLCFLILCHFEDL